MIIFVLPYNSLNINEAIGQQIQMRKQMKISVMLISSAIPPTRSKPVHILKVRRSVTAMVTATYPFSKNEYDFRNQHIRIYFVLSFIQKLHGHLEDVFLLVLARPKDRLKLSRRNYLTLSNFIPNTWTYLYFAIHHK